VGYGMGTFEVGEGLVGVGGAMLKAVVWYLILWWERQI